MTHRRMIETLCEINKIVELQDFMKGIRTFHFLSFRKPEAFCVFISGISGFIFDNEPYVHNNKNSIFCSITQCVNLNKFNT